MEDRKNMGYYFIIGMDLLPSDERLRDDRIERLALDEFEKLYPVYNFFRAPWDTEKVSGLNRNVLYTDQRFFEYSPWF